MIAEPIFCARCGTRMYEWRPPQGQVLTMRCAECRSIEVLHAGETFLRCAKPERVGSEKTPLLSGRPIDEIDLATKYRLVNELGDFEGCS